MARKSSSSEEASWEKYSNCWTLSSENDNEKVKEFLPTGSVILDALITGTNKGIPAGANVCFTAEPSVGKTTIALGIARKICLSGKKVIYFDVENAITEYQLTAFKLNEFLGKSFFLFDCTTFDEVEEILSDLIYKKDLAAVFIDSLTVLSDEKDLDLKERVSSMDVAKHARLVGKFVKKYRHHARRAGVVMFYINQVRNKDIGARTGAKVKPAGGFGQEFLMDVHVFFSHGDKLYRSEETSLGKQDRMLYGEDLRAKCIKNKYCRSGIEMTVTLIIGQGVSNFAAYSKWLVNHGDIKTSGPYFSITINGKTEKILGQLKVNEYLRDHAAEIKKYIEDNGGFFLYRTEDKSIIEPDESSSESNQSEEQNVTSEAKEEVDDFEIN